MWEVQRRNNGRKAYRDLKWTNVRRCCRGHCHYQVRSKGLLHLSNAGQLYNCCAVLHVSTATKMKHSFMYLFSLLEHKVWILSFICKFLLFTGGKKRRKESLGGSRPAPAGLLCVTLRRDLELQDCVHAFILLAELLIMEFLYAK